VANFGFTKVIQRFVPVYPDHQRAILKYALRFTAIGGMLAIALAWYFRGALSNFSSDAMLMEEFYGLFIALLLAQFFFETGSSIFSANFKTHYGLFANNVSVRIAIAGILVAKFVFDFGPGLFISLVGLAYLLNHAILLILALRTYYFVQPISWPEMPKQEFTAYALFMLLLTLVSQSFLYLDGLLIGHFLVLSQLAIFDLTKNLASVADLPARALGSSALPTVAQLMGKRHFAKVQEVYKKGSFVQLFAGLFLFSIVSIHLDLLLTYVYQGRFDAVKTLFYIVFAGKLVDMATGLNWAIISNSSKYWANLIIGTSVLIITVWLEWILIPKYGLIGAVAGIAIALLLNNSARSMYLFIQFKMNPFGSIHLKLLPVLLLAAFVGLFQSGHIWLDVILKDVLLMAIFLYYIRPGASIPEIEELINRLRNRKDKAS
jgi:O-antigen/teichoic acid export membrane protein